MALCCVGLLAINASAEVLKWVDENGKVHYGDDRQMRGRAQQVDTKISSYEQVELRRAQSAVGDGVIMFSTDWCGYCKQARRYFAQHGIAYTEYDIEKDRRARAAYDRLGGRGVPVILVGKSQMTGFSVAGFENLYQQIN